MKTSVAEVFSGAMCLLVLGASALLQMADSTTESIRYPYQDFPAGCTCRYEWFNRSHCERFDPERYPTYDEMGFTEDCIPSIPSNHRVCYKTKIMSCTSETGYPYYGCQLFPKAKRYTHFRLNELRVFGGTVFIHSTNNTETNSLSFYNVDVAENSTGNCSGMLLQHISDHPEHLYVDKFENSTDNSTTTATTTTTTTECRSYVKIKYTRYGRDETIGPLCREKLANLDRTLAGVTSVFIVYWTNTRKINSGSFNLRARCIS